MLAASVLHGIGIDHQACDPQDSLPIHRIGKESASLIIIFLKIIDKNRHQPILAV